MGNHLLKDPSQIGESSNSYQLFEKPIFKPHEIPPDKQKALNRPYRMELSNQIEIARVTKMIEDLDRKLDKFVTIPDSPSIGAFRNLRTLDQASSEEERPKVKTLETLATWRPRR